MQIHYHFATTLVSEESEDFDMLVDELLKYKPVNTVCHEQKSACNIGTAIYEVSRQHEVKRRRLRPA